MVWEGRSREAPPYPDSAPALAGDCPGRPCGKPLRASREAGPRSTGGRGRLREPLRCRGEPIPRHESAKRRTEETQKGLAISEASTHERSRSPESVFTIPGITVQLHRKTQAVAVIEPAFQATLMLGGSAPPLTALRPRAAARPAVGLPPVAGPAEVEHRGAPRPAAPHRAPPPGSGSHAGPPRRQRRVRTRRSGTGKTDRPAWEDGGARPGGLRSRAHGSRRLRDAARSRPLGTGSCGCKNTGACDRSRAANASRGRQPAMRVGPAPIDSARRPRCGRAGRRRYQRTVARTSLIAPAPAKPSARSSSPSSGRAGTGSGFAGVAVAASDGGLAPRLFTARNWKV